MSRWMIVGMTVLAVIASSAGPAQAEIKVLICAGDYGMWAQDRPKLIMDAVNKVAAGQCVFEVEQSYNFVKKLQAPGYAQRFDVIVAGDIGLGQIPTRMQEALVKFVKDGGGFVYVVWAKSALSFRGPREAEPMPLADILPYKFFEGCDPVKNAVADAMGYKPDSDFFKGLDFSTLDAKVLTREQAQKPLLLKRPCGQGAVLALYGAFGASYKYVSYAKYERIPGGWDDWPGLGELWVRVLKSAAAASPVKDKSLKNLDALVKDTPLKLEVAVDATKEIDDIRAGNFSMVSLSQLYVEDGGSGEEFFKELNPKGWFDRGVSDKLLESKAGKLFPDKVALFKQYGIAGIMMGNNSYGSYYMMTEAEFNKAAASFNDEQKQQPQNQSYAAYVQSRQGQWRQDADRMIATAKKYPGLVTYMQPGNEPPCNEGYFTFHNFMAQAVIKGDSSLKVIGPNTAFNLTGPDEKAMKEFIENCGQNTDMLCWHIYARAPESVAQQVKYWSKYAEGKLRSAGPARVMFTEADTWNTRDSQFNYFMDRAFTFLPMPEILATFQYCIRPRYEGGTYWFGVLFPSAKDPKMREFDTNYNSYWILRDLRGKMLSATMKGPSDAAAAHGHVIASSDDGGKTVTAVIYYDTGYYDAPAGQKSPQAAFTVQVKLPSGKYTMVRSNARWDERKAGEPSAPVEGQATVEVTLQPCSAAALTWTRR